MARPSIAIVVRPYLYATALARVFEDRGYEVTAPDLAAEDWDPTGPYDVVLTCLPLEVEGDPIRVDVPDGHAGAVRLSVGGVSVELDLDPAEPVRDLARILDALVAQPSRRAAATHLTQADLREQRRR